MKKLMFASALAAGFAAFGWNDSGTINAIDFERYPDQLSGEAGIGMRDDAGNLSSESGFFWFYESKDSSTDGSGVKTYGMNDNLPTFNYTNNLLPAEFIATGGAQLANNKYLELSTEGGTLWRSFTDTGDCQGLGQGVDLGTDGTGTKLYIDTMVQFTPTEDGDDPQVTADDKLAIWLNVETAEGSDEATTNLCVLAYDYTAAKSVRCEITNAGEVKPGVWYRLTVQAIGDITGGNMNLPGFKIWLDGRLLTSNFPAIDSVGLDYLVNDVGTLTADEAADIAAGSVFASLQGAGLDGTSVIFQGVGFKGSGAIDDLVISDGDPKFFTQANSLDFTLTWDANVSAVSYTIGSGTAISVEDLTDCTLTVAVPAGETVTVAATAKDWYEVKAGIGAVTVDEAKTVAITTGLVTSPFEGVTTSDVLAKWAVTKGIKPGDITADNLEAAYNAYLMNTALGVTAELKITAIEELTDGWNITVKATAGEDATIDLATINGKLLVKTAATLEGLATAVPAEFTVTPGANGEATIKVTGTGNFMKATVGLPAPVVEE